MPAGFVLQEFRYIGGRTVAFDGWNYVADAEGNLNTNPYEAYDYGVYPDPILVSAAFSGGDTVTFSWETGELDEEGYPVLDSGTITVADPIDPVIRQEVATALVNWVHDAYGAFDEVPEDLDAIEYVGESRGDRCLLINSDGDFFADIEGNSFTANEGEAFDLGVIPSLDGITNARYNAYSGFVTGGYSKNGVSFEETARVEGL